MVHPMWRHQLGMSFISVVMIAALSIAVFGIAGQSLPIVLEYQAAKKAVFKIATEGGTVAQMRQAFDRAADVNHITAISGQDLNIRTVNGRAVVGFAYEREIPLVGSAYLVYRFNHQTN